MLQKFAGSSQDDSLSLRKKETCWLKKRLSWRGTGGRIHEKCQFKKSGHYPCSVYGQFEAVCYAASRLNHNAKKAAKRWREKAAKGSSASSGGKNSLQAFEEDQSLIAGNRGALPELFGVGESYGKTEELQAAKACRHDERSAGQDGARPWGRSSAVGIVCQRRKHIIDTFLA